MTKSQKNILGEINRCSDLSSKSDAIKQVLGARENPDLISSIQEYATLHHKKRTEGNLNSQEKSKKLALKDLIARQVA